MRLKIPARTSSPRSYSVIPCNNHHVLCKVVCCDKNSTSGGDKKFKFRLVGRSFGDGKWKLNDIDPNAMHESLQQWLSKTRTFLNEVTSPLVKNVNERRPTIRKDTRDVEEISLEEYNIDSRTSGGYLSIPAIISIEQFSRMNGLTGQMMQNIFKTLVPNLISNDARHLVEYCCFRFLSRDSSEIHPSLEDPAFQRLLFITMLAWEHPYSTTMNLAAKASKRFSVQRRFVGEEAFVRIAPAISGVADWSTAHNTFKALAGDEQGISFQSWSAYISELIKVHEARKSYQYRESPIPVNERILCLGSSRKHPVLKWENNVALPGKLTLTDTAIYFEVGLVGQGNVLRLDLTTNDCRVEKARVGPLGFDLFDSAISITSASESKTWVLEFIDFGGEMRRDVWFAFISEIISLHKFIREFGPRDGDRSLYHVYGALKGKARATTCATNAIARLQALQFLRKVLEEPTKLVPFSYLSNAPYGDIVMQTLAVNCWGGPFITNTEGDYKQGQLARTKVEAPDNTYNVFDIDGSVYLRKWMRSPSWASNASLAFWKNSSLRRGVILSKNIVVADMTLVEKAAATCRDKYRVAEKTQATIDAAMLEGIPSNIDLLKELVLPATYMLNNLEKLRRWQDPLVTASFLAIVYTLIFRNMLFYIFPTSLMALATGMLLLKGLKEQGRLGRFFGKVTIHDQPPSNTIQKIIAVKEAMREVEKYLQNLNVSLLKLRNILLAGHPQVTTEVALVLMFGSVILFMVPFKYILACLIFDLFTRELQFRRQMVLRFMSLLKERWDTVPAAPVVVLPHEAELDGTEPANQRQILANERANQIE